MPLTIVAHIHAEPGKETFVHDALQKLVAPTRAEPGCVTYDLHRDNADPGHFMFFEIWENRALWQDHMQAPHLKAHGQATQGAVARVELFEMTRTA